MVPTKRFIRNAAIISISVMAAMELVIFWLMPYPVWSFETLIAELFVIGAASVGALIGWLVLRAMYPQLRGKTENMVESIKEQLELEKKEGIEYTLNNEDILAFNIYNQEHSPRAGLRWKLWLQ
jgi:uncharacterized membrane protein YciS (DUF1049 family)